TTSRVWYASDSSAARTRCGRSTPRVRPTSAPRADASQYGAPSPTNAGTMYTPSVESTDFAIFSDSAAFLSNPSPSRSHWIAAPATNTDPSSAYAARPCASHAIVVTRPECDLT